MKQDSVMNEQEHNKLGDIQTSVHHLDKRVTVLETRADAQAESIKTIQSDVRENKKMSMEILGILREDGKSKARHAWAIIATLVGVIATLILAVVGL